MPATVPPPDIPLSLLAASGAGLVAAGTVVSLVASQLVASPTQDRSIAAVHLVMLAFLTVGVLGAVHQFSTVVGRRPLRSSAVGRLTVVLSVVGSWALPAGFAAGDDQVVAAAGALLATAFVLAAWNLSGPLLGTGSGPSIIGLRISVVGLVATAGFGVTYAFDRQAGEAWFGLDPNVVLAHAHIGLLAWLGLTYVAVAEKLWPMFLLAHRPGRSPGAAAVWLIPVGVVALVVGLMTGQSQVAAAGAAVVGAGLGAHVASFVGLVRHRRRPLELLHAFVAASIGFLAAAACFAAAAGLAPAGSAVRSRMVSAEIASLAAWLGLALIGHAHKVVPFIAWGILRARGFRAAPDGSPLLFSHLWDRRLARCTCVAAASGFGAVVAGLAGGWVAPVATAGPLLSIAGLLALANLGLGPVRVARRLRRQAIGDLPPQIPALG
ncbi:MAG TPA: hypothetical protein VFP54_10630 [Acidimicrobiales bacterium]|nr:hypothetical protein [Acidimicrobiales bacterium]